MAVPQCCAKSLQPSYVSGELENPENPEDPEDLGRLGEVLEGVVGVEVVEEEGDVEREDAQQIDHIQEGDCEEELKRRSICANRVCQITLWGATMNLMRYSKVNQPTKIASVTRKK